MLANTSYISHMSNISHMSHVSDLSYLIFVGYGLRYSMNCLISFKLFEVVQNCLNYFKDNVFDIFLENIIVFKNFEFWFIYIYNI